MTRRTLGLALVLGLLVALPSQGRAFTTRVHIVLANDIREALISSGDGTIQLRWSDYAVQIPQGDADAIVNQPEAFRAGAIGPDVVVFPAMTDGTHSVDQNPYGQCEMLYQDAFTEPERAYALGCFLHGATDAVAHHFVNYFTGETFTLNPLTANRGTDYDHVIGHIVTESIIQAAVYTADPGAFSAGELSHEIQQDFVLRNYFNIDSPIWQRMTVGSMAKWEAVQAIYPRPDPGEWPPQSPLYDWVTGAGFHPWEYIAMAPVFIDEVQFARTQLRDQMEARIQDLALDPEIDPLPGPDGVIGTVDDETACSASCPDTFGEYWILVHLLAPRYDTSGNELPSAFDKISTDLGDDLYGFLPAFVQVIQNVSTFLNAEISDDADHGLDIDPSLLTGMFAPIDDWAAVAFAIDWTTTGMAVSPDWYNDLSLFLDMFGVNIGIEAIIQAIFQPIVDAIRDAIIEQVRNYAEMFVDDLKAQYEAFLAPWTDSVNNRLDASAPPDLGGHALDYVMESGIMAHPFNLAAVSFANHEVLLVAGEEIANGPASFDASYTPEWTQIGQCDYLREAVFPHGLGLVPLLSVQASDGTYYESGLVDNSPVECHDGSLSEFGTPSQDTCTFTTLDDLLFTPVGSITRAFPPTYAAGSPGCRGLTVPGLPEPPPGIYDAGMGDGGMTETEGGCGCRTIGAGESSHAAWFAFAVVGLALVRRRRGAL